MKRRLAMLAAAILLPAGAIALPAAQAVAAPGPGAPPAGGAAAAEMLGALQRDLGLTADEARARLAREDDAGRTDARLRKELGAAYGGAWLTAGATSLVVAVTGKAHAAKVTAAGATAKVVTRSEAQLDAVKSTLDRNAAKAPAASVPGWYVDVVTNTVVVLARGDAAAARAFAATAQSGAVRVVATNENPVPLYDVRGGDAYYMGGRCSVGFSVAGGFVTAGHCGSVGTATQGFNRVAQGTFRGSSFPGNDYAWVQVNTTNWTPQPWVNNYAGGNVTVAGSTEAAVGASICRSGSTTGWHCGTVSAKNQTVNYAEGTVTGLTRTNVCAEPGDSGGSYISGQQAQGVTSGGSGNCTSGGTTYFQPVNEILSAYGLTLTTSGGGEPPPPTGCSGYEFTRSGSLGSGANVYQPDGSYYYSSASGTHRACLDGPTGVDFDLYLQRWNGSAWSTVASGTSPNPDETVSYSGSAGYYRYRVHAYAGSGSYTLGFTNP
jgi:streptogrisin C